MEGCYAYQRSKDANLGPQTSINGIESEKNKSTVKVH
jgi:hypothetical protein